MRIIAGRWRGHRLKSLKGKGVRPTTDRVREAWMAALGPELEDARVLDLFAGSGALGLEALSRGARDVVFVERARGALATLQANIRILGADEECRVVRGDAIAFVRGLDTGAFDLALADPPYDRGLAGELVELFRNTAFADALWVEHRTAEVLPALDGLRQRRYGDTTITIVTRGQ